MKKRRRISTLVVIAVILFLAAGIWTRAIPRWMGQWLVKDGPVQKADLIYVYAGRPAERPAYGAELFSRGLAPTVVVAGSIVPPNLEVLGLDFNEGTISRIEAEKNGVPPDRIVQLQEGTSTYEETAALEKYMEKNGLDSAILVTSPFHTRRVRMCAEMIFTSPDVRIDIAPVPDSDISLDQWWKEENDTVTVIVEYIKLAYYLFAYKLK